MAFKTSAKKRKYAREYMSKRYREDPDFRRRQTECRKAVAKRYKTELKNLLADFRSQGCKLCREMDPACLVAHHLFDKTFLISHANRRRLSPKRIAEELKKCVCLCSNCHMKLHAGSIPKEALA